CQYTSRLTPRAGTRLAFPIPKQQRGEVLQVGPPNGEIVPAAAVHVPDMQHLLRFEPVVEVPANSHQPALSPQDTHSSFRNFAPSARSLIRTFTFFVFRGGRKPAHPAEHVKIDQPKLSACPPPLDRPARTQVLGLTFTEKVLWMNGIRSMSSSLSVG